MTWLTKMTEAINYIEANLTDKPDYEKAASIACCSLSQFQNMFTFITDIAPSEYVRRRRMALAAKELTGDKMKIIDLSHKYGYTSPEAFTRSFKLFHGISPSEVRKYEKYVDYPPISFQLQVIGGHFMQNAKFETFKDILVRMETIELPRTLKMIVLSNENYPDFGCIDAYNEKFKHLIKDRHSPYTEIGLSSNYAPNSWYAFGCQADTLDDVPEGMAGIDIGVSKFACLTFRMLPDSTSHDLVGGADGPGDGMKIAGEYLTTQWIPKNVDNLLGYYECEHSYGFNIGSKTIYCPIEVYKVDIENELEMCFYLPLV